MLYVIQPLLLLFVALEGNRTSQVVACPVPANTPSLGPTARIVLIFVSMVFKIQITVPANVLETGEEILLGHVLLATDTQWDYRFVMEEETQVLPLVGLLALVPGPTQDQIVKVVVSLTAEMEPSILLFARVIATRTSPRIVLGNKF